MKPLKPFGIFVCVLFVVSGLGMLTDVILPSSANVPAEEETSIMGQPNAHVTNTAITKPPVDNEDIPVDSPTVYPAGMNPAALSVCQAALKQYLSYVDARAAYLLRTGAKQETDQFLASRDQAVIGELAIFAAKAGTFQGNPDHFNQLTTLAAERQAIALATQWHAADSTNQSRQEVKTYDVNLQC